MLKLFKWLLNLPFDTFHANIFSKRAHTHKLWRRNLNCIKIKFIQDALPYYGWLKFFKIYFQFTTKILNHIFSFIFNLQQKFLNHICCIYVRRLAICFNVESWWHQISEASSSFFVWDFVSINVSTIKMRIFSYESQN